MTLVATLELIPLFDLTHLSIYTRPNFLGKHSKTLPHHTSPRRRSARSLTRSQVLELTETSHTVAVLVTEVVLYDTGPTGGQTTNNDRV